MSQVELEAIKAACDQGRRVPGAYDTSDAIPWINQDYPVFFIYFPNCVQTSRMHISGSTLCNTFTIH